MPRSIAERCLRFLIAALLFLGAARAWSAAAPDALVKEVTLDVVQIVSKDRDIQEGNRDKLLTLVETKVLPHFNFASMTALAMGANWRSATPEQRKRLIDAFRMLLVRTYASALSAYRDQKFEFRPLRMNVADTDVTVHVRIVQAGAQAVAIDYDMEKTAAGWKVYNVHVGGVSLVLNYRTDFAMQVRNGGIDGLIRSLEAKNKALESGGSAK